MSYANGKLISMGRFFIILFICCLLSFVSCVEKVRSSSIEHLQVSNVFGGNEDTSNTNATELCNKCDSIYSIMPADSFAFEKLYGYPLGTRQHEVKGDFEDYFICLDICYNYDQLVSIVKLGSAIKYDADGPAFLQHQITKYLKENKGKALVLYNEIN